MIFLALIFFIIVIAFAVKKIKSDSSDKSKPKRSSNESYYFCATMSHKTPLKFLEMHGVSSNNPTEVPERYGIWLVNLPSEYAYLDKGATMASTVGSIPRDGGDYLPYLINIRKATEAVYLHNPILIDDLLERANIIAEIKCGHTESGGSYFEKTFPGGIESVFKFLLSELDQRIPKGISFSNVLELNKQELNTVESIVSAPDDVLLGLKGVGKKTLEKIRSSSENIGL